MKRVRNLGRWILVCVGCMLVALFDTAVRGRSHDEQMKDVT